MNSLHSFVTAMRGPVVLVTLGILLLIQRFADASFGKTWPILLIVFGVMKLLERAATRTGQPLNMNTPGGPMP